MPNTHMHLRTHAPILAIGLLAVVASFSLGVSLTGNVHTIDETSATDTTIEGDVTDDGVIDLQDVIAILEVSQGYRTPTTTELLRDPSGNGTLTVDDALRLLRDLSSH